MRHVLHSLAVIGAIAFGGAAALAAEPPRTSSLGWARLPGAEACVGAPELARAVERQLGRAVFISPAQAEVLVEGRVEPGEPGAAFRFRAHIALTDSRGAVLGTRDLATQSASCRALDEELALVIALLIDPAAALGPPRRPPPPPLPLAAPSCPPVPPSPPASPPPRERWRVGLAVGGAVAAGLLPGAGVGLVLRGEIVPPWFVPIQLGGAVWANASAETAGRGATLSLSWQGRRRRQRRERLHLRAARRRQCQVLG